MIKGAAAVEAEAEEGPAGSGARVSGVVSEAPGLTTLLFFFFQRSISLFCSLANSASFGRKIGRRARARQAGMQAAVAKRKAREREGGGEQIKECLCWKKHGQS